MEKSTSDILSIVYEVGIFVIPMVVCFVIFYFIGTTTWLTDLLDSKIVQRIKNGLLYILYIFFFFLGVHSKRQQVIYSLIILLRQEGLGFRRISRKLNQWGIKTHRGKQWFNTSVSSVLKRKHERDVLFDDIRNQHYPTKISKMELKYYTFD